MVIRCPARVAARCRSGRHLAPAGFALLEVLVALIILGLVGLGYLELFHASHRVAAGTREWSEAVEDAEDGIEEAKLGTLVPDGRVTALAGGYRRQVTRRPWGAGFDLVTVTIFLPGGGQFALERLAKPSGLTEQW